MRGRKPVLNQEQVLQVRKLKEDGMSVAQIAETYKCSIPVIYKALKIVEETKVA